MGSSESVALQVLMDSWYIWLIVGFLMAAKYVFVPFFRRVMKGRR